MNNKGTRIDNERLGRQYVMIYQYEKAIAQVEIQEVPVLEQQEICFKELLMFESERGSGSLGSSGK